MSDFKLNKQEIDEWEKKLSDCKSYHINELRRQLQNKHKIGMYKEEILKQCLDYLSKVCDNNANTNLYSLEYGDKQFGLRYGRICDSSITFEQFEKDYDEMEKEIDNTMKEYTNMMDLLYSHPTEEDIKVLMEWTDKYKIGEIKCGQN